ncbi:hypothetical protein WJX74_007251 [Apatococcus lobatus]|uniref:Helicase ATP-binding domain-containing protein n=1 Tax=Apatococcus lobatus TaxID=904363 RepID=A0AAW1QDL1_9CHLO
MSSQTPEAESTEQALLKVKELIGKSTYKDKLVPLLRAYKRSRSSELLQQGLADIVNSSGSEPDVLNTLTCSLFSEGSSTACTARKAGGTLSSTPAATPTKRTSDGTCPTPQSKDRKLARLLQIAPSAAATTYEANIPALQPGIHSKHASASSTFHLPYHPHFKPEPSQEAGQHIHDGSAAGLASSADIFPAPQLQVVRDHFPSCSNGRLCDDGSPKLEPDTEAIPSGTATPQEPKRFSGHLSQRSSASPADVMPLQNMHGQQGEFSSPKGHHEGRAMQHSLPDAKQEAARPVQGPSGVQQGGYEGSFSKLDDGKSLQQKQKERRQRKAQFLLGDTDDVKGPSVGFSAVPMQGSPPQAVRLGRTCTASMPMPPNRSQVMLMQKAVAALEGGHHALLESPTGTGKTLALLCSTLAWQAAQAAADAAPGAAQGSQVPRVFWAARTHAQLDHAVRELRRTRHRPMMTILASRERFCLHPDIAVAPNKTEACEQATIIGRMSCSYLEHAEAIIYPQAPHHLAAYKPGGRVETFQIEELVKEGARGHVCPYHASRDVLTEGAALIFVTYAQLLDPPVRSANGLDDLLLGAAVIFDEGHNVAGECREAATLQMSRAETEALLAELTRMHTSLTTCKEAAKWRHAAEFAVQLRTLLSRMLAWLVRQIGSAHLPYAPDSQLGEGQESCVQNGSVASQAVLGAFELSESRLVSLQSRLKAMRRGLIEEGFESTAVKSGPINELEALLSKLLFLVQTGGTAYQLLLHRQSAPGPGTVQPMRAAGLPAPRRDGGFAFICLHAATALRPLATKARTVLLASGTLGPLPSLAAELGLQEDLHNTAPELSLAKHAASSKAFRNWKPVGREAGPAPSTPRPLEPAAMSVSRVEMVACPHHRHLARNLLPLSLASAPGPSGAMVRLDSTFSQRGEAGYQDALGTAILTACQNIPDGVLCFFPSWGLLSAATQCWSASGLMQKLSSVKLVVQEPHNVSGEVFEEAINTYRDGVAKGTGALLLAVSRGRASEGVDFPDSLARGVIMVGIPYPPLMDIRVRLKRQHNDANAGLLGSGSSWYAAEAFRAVNQAVGRLIRHHSDFGAVLLLDYRYQQSKYRTLMSAWLQPLFQTGTFHALPALLQGFFHGKAALAI